MAQWNANGATVSIHEEEWAAWARVVRGSTFASTLYLSAAEQSVVYQVRQTAVQVHRRQATFEALPRGYQFGQAVVHVGPQTSNEKITWGKKKKQTGSLTQLTLTRCSSCPKAFDGPQVGTPKLMHDVVTLQKWLRWQSLKQVRVSVSDLSSKVTEIFLGSVHACQIRLPKKRLRQQKQDQRF